MKRNCCTTIERNPEIKALVDASFEGRRGSIINRRASGEMIIRRLRPIGPLFHPCGPFCVGAGLKQRRNVGRILRHHKQMLIPESASEWIFISGETYASRQCDCTCGFEERKGE